MTKGEIEYVDPLQGEISSDELRRQCELENRQLAAAKKLKEEGRSVLVGYKIPDPNIENRISVHAARHGWIPPTEKKRQVRLAENAATWPSRRTIKE